ncbi:hypothetical protein HBI56_214230 [Parastagonospora nodorum]|uniref:Uncharacterized protein n=1 Tax=Phaeosphaeria nodorum (strain SN15 / ATCC MYA-4574 / FGSC 10173) TaxID=321614 RepID=A0A7U2I2I6_PHANO|nr:hypothetical protein HBH56_230170 [Parastagonospora nodorum]QRC99388.1 hypothetical protein JI435_413340 [Parastagonospora nodorum SN15]KAH3924446.1 hypothetical protein HBH54_195020 [Parastagonospora nodorum]KAH3940157.1 hypothetical protein HBH53_222610 [Parastagonospora nodorum]KAH3958424.1 hypothetical protein HBH51_209890 [Parastagonospora nodorum]
MEPQIIFGLTLLISACRRCRRNRSRAVPRLTILSYTCCANTIHRRVTFQSHHRKRNGAEVFGETEACFS